MKHFCHKICLVVLACFPYLSASAYDFTAGGLEFTITSFKDLTVSVDGDVGFSDKLVIPQTIVYKGRTLTVTSVGDNAFSGTNSLQSVSLPNTILSIGDYAFSDNSKSLRAIYVYAEKVPILPYNSCAFEGCDSKKCKVYVPIGTYDAYSRSQFGYFENIVEFDATSFRNTIATAENQDTTHYVVNDKKEHTH